MTLIFRESLHQGVSNEGGRLDAVSVDINTPRHHWWILQYAVDFLGRTPDP